LPARLCRALGGAALAVAALGCGGCSMSYQLESYFADKTPTGSIAKPAPAMPPERDLAYAKAAASEVLKRGEKDASQDWENPATGARGTVTPMASAHTQDGQTCRDFLASYVNKTEQSWLQGEACKEAQGDWQVRALKPWKSS
jgi:surface antigen